ncbi:MAG: VWA domain-containing protein [Deltaproteobacteria bacterium]|nr:VWA domain-containing protein [Deltaproteobacteria bacterium]
MRALSLAPLLLASAACAVRAPGSVRLTLQVHAEVRAEVPSAPPVAVPLSGAPVVEFFGVPLDGVQDVVFVLDRSGSMDDPAQGQLAQLGAPGAPAPARPRKIDIAQQELIDALQRLPPGTRMNVLFFNDGLEAFAVDTFPLEEADRGGLIGFVQATAPSGATALAPAMRTALLMNARRVVLLSDGLGNIGGDARNVLRDAREAMRGGVRIDTIGLGRDQDGALLQALAAESGGLYQSL